MRQETRLQPPASREARNSKGSNFTRSSEQKAAHLRSLKQSAPSVVDPQAFLKSKDPKVQKEIQRRFEQRMEDDLDTLVDHLMKDRELILANGLLPLDALEVKMNIQKVSSLEKLYAALTQQEEAAADQEDDRGQDRRGAGAREEAPRRGSAQEAERAGLLEKVPAV